MKLELRCFLSALLNVNKIIKNSDKSIYEQQKEIESVLYQANLLYLKKGKNWINVSSDCYKYLIECSEILLPRLANALAKSL
jgi:hypothetical protein